MIGKHQDQVDADIFRLITYLQSFIYLLTYSFLDGSFTGKLSIQFQLVVSLSYSYATVYNILSLRSIFNNIQYSSVFYDYNPTVHIHIVYTSRVDICTNSYVRTLRISIYEISIKNDNKRNKIKKERKKWRGVKQENQYIRETRRLR